MLTLHYLTYKGIHRNYRIKINYRKIMKYKNMKIFIYLLSIILPMNALAQQKVKVEIECVYVVKYDKKEIIHKFLNERKRLNKEPYKKMIDYSKETYYFTLTIDSLKRIQSLDNIANCLNITDYKNTECFLFPPFNDYIKQTYNVESPNYNFPNNTTYYKGLDTTSLYQIYYIKGQADRIEVKNDRSNSEQYFNIALNWQIPPNTINKTIPSFYVYLFNKIDTIKSNIQLLGFNIWKYEE